MTRRSSAIILTSLLLSFTLLGMDCPMNGGMNGNGNGNGNDNTGGNGSSLTPIELNITKLTTDATTESGPTAGDGVMAFNAEGNSILAWLRSGETSADVKEVPAPAGLTHDPEVFQMEGTKLIVDDRNSGAIYVFDTVSETSQTIPTASVNVTSNFWAADGQYVASVNATVTTQDGANRRVKVTDITNINNFMTTPFNDPAQTPNAITVDAQSEMIVTRGNDTFFVYDINNAGDPIDAWMISDLQGGVGAGTEIKLDGNFLAFFNDDGEFSLLNITDGTITRPMRNPGRTDLGLDIQENRFAYFALQNDDDGSSISIVNRALIGSTGDVDDLVDPEGEFINGNDEFDGRVGFGFTVSISPNGRFVAIAGGEAVDVDDRERLYLSIDGGPFRPIADEDDETGFLRAAAVSVSDNLIAFLIPADLDAVISANTVGYAPLPPE